jgi:hypothetical protein
MRFAQLATVLPLAAGMAAFPAVSMAATGACTPGEPTAASHTWNFHAEATRLLNGIQQDAVRAKNHADKLETFTMEPGIDWQVHVYELSSLKHEVDDMGAKLCRLETIRRVSAPWQQKAIQRVAPQVRYMADNVTDALNFAGSRESSFWLASYRHNVSNLYRESSQLAKSVKNYEKYASARTQVARLGNELHMAG